MPRDPFLQPFASDSPLNMPIGSGAVYDAITTPGWDLPNIEIFIFGGPDQANEMLPIYKATATDPLRNVRVGPEVRMVNIDPTVSDYFATDATAETTYQIRIPSGATPSGPLTWLPTYTHDQTMYLLDADGKTFHEIYLTNFEANGLDYYSYALYRYDAKLDGYGKSSSGAAQPDGDTRAKHTARASGLWGFGGLIRAGELAAGIPHALAATCPPNQFNKNGPGGRSYVWPASASDDTATYSSTGNVHMGSLLAIPYSVDINALTWQTAKGKNMAFAMQRYGIYLVDSTGPASSTLQFGTERAAAAEIPVQTSNPQSPFFADLRQAASHLKVISNNGPNSIGGGGTPLQALAAPFTGVTVPTGYSSTGKTSTTITVTWTAVSGATGYDHAHRRDADTIPTVVSVAAPPYTVPSLATAQNYRLKVRAKDASGPGDYTSEISVTTDPTPSPPPVPASLTLVSIDYRTVEGTWPDVAGEDNYEVEISKNAGAWTAIAPLAANTVLYRYTDPSPGSGNHDMQMRVRSTSVAGGPSAFRTSAVVKTPQQTTPVSGQVDFGPAKAGEWSLSDFTNDEARRLITISEAFSPAPFKNETVVQVAVTSLSGAFEGMYRHPLTSTAEAWGYFVFALPTDFVGPAGDFVTFAQMHDPVNNKILAALRVNGTGNLLQVNSEATGDTFPKTIISAVTLNKIHAVKVYVKTGASGVIKVWYDNTLKVNLSALTMTGWNFNQVRCFGVRVPGGWTGKWLQRQPVVSNQDISRPPIAGDASVFPIKPVFP